MTEFPPCNPCEPDPWAYRYKSVYSIALGQLVADRFPVFGDPRWPMLDWYDD